MPRDAGRLAGSSASGPLPPSRALSARELSSRPKHPESLFPRPDPCRRRVFIYSFVLRDAITSGRCCSALSFGAPGLPCWVSLLLGRHLSPAVIRRAHGCPRCRLGGVHQPAPRTVLQASVTPAPRPPRVKGPGGCASPDTLKPVRACRAQLTSRPAPRCPSWPREPQTLNPEEGPEGNHRPPGVPGTLALSDYSGFQGARPPPSLPRRAASLPRCPALARASSCAMGARLPSARPSSADRSEGLLRLLLGQLLPSAPFVLRDAREAPV